MIYFVNQLVGGNVPDLIRPKPKVTGTENGYACGLYVLHILHHLSKYNNLDFAAFNYDQDLTLRVKIDSLHEHFLRKLSAFFPDVELPATGLDTVISGSDDQETTIAKILDEIGLLDHFKQEQRCSARTMIEAFKNFGARDKKFHTGPEKRNISVFVSDNNHYQVSPNTKGMNSSQRKRVRLVSQSQESDAEGSFNY